MLTITLPGVAVRFARSRAPGRQHCAYIRMGITAASKLTMHQRPEPAPPHQNDAISDDTQEVLALLDSIALERVQDDFGNGMMHAKEGCACQWYSSIPGCKVKDGIDDVECR